MLNIVYRVIDWIKKHEKETIILGLIVLVGAILRLYKIADYMTFLGDEGRDAILVRRLLVNFDPILIGPGTSIGNMYLGPLYYYMMAPALWLAGFSPVGPSIQIALLGVATIFLVWWVAREWFSSKAGLIAAGLYAISPTPVIFSLSSWNPNIMPFFALLSIYSIWRVWKKHEWNWLIVLGISYAFVLQSHYLGLLLFPTLLIFWFSTLRKIRNLKLEIRNFTKYSLYGLGIFVILMFPLLLFDIRHGWMNFNAIKNFLFAGGSANLSNPIASIVSIPQKTLDYTIRLIGARSLLTGAVTGIFILISSLVFLSDKLFFIFVWIGVGLLGLGFYKYAIYDHYYGFIFPALFILFGALSEKLTNKSKKRGKIIVAFLIFLIVLFSIKNSHLWTTPNRQMTRARLVAEKIREEANDQRFNLAVIADRNYEDGYQYFLEKDNSPVVEIDAQKPETITEQLFVVCEKAKADCDPTHNPKTEVANFGWTIINNQWDISGVTLFKLIHSK